MTWLPHGPPTPTGQHVGFIESGLDTVLSTLVNWRSGLGQRPAVRRPVAGFPECVPLLEPPAGIWTRELLIDMGPWTAYLNNSIQGGDPFPAVGVLTERLDCRGVLATHAPMREPGHAATAFELLGPEGPPPLHYIRTVGAYAADGRWSWDESGTPLPFEDLARYTRRLIRERLTRDLLVRYLGELGIDVSGSAYGEAALVTQRPWRWWRR
ncbi:MAG: hypothetical protein ACRDOO_16730 [Actinomadura sp.]